jgi:hypothetical protein
MHTRIRARDDPGAAIRNARRLVGRRRSDSLHASAPRDPARPPDATSQGLQTTINHLFTVLRNYRESQLLRGAGDS